MSKYPISEVCPKCGGLEYTRRKSESFVAFALDRVCKACETRYTPPTPRWAAFVFILAGLPLAGFGVFAVYTRLRDNNVLGIPALACEGSLGVLGLLAIGLGIRALLNPGKV